LLSAGCSSLPTIGDHRPNADPELHQRYLQQAPQGMLTKETTTLRQKVVIQRAGKEDVITIMVYRAPEGNVAVAGMSSLGTTFFQMTASSLASTPTIKANPLQLPDRFLTDGMWRDTMLLFYLPHLMPDVEKPTARTYDDLLIGVLTPYRNDQKIEWLLTKDDETGSVTCRKARVLAGDKVLAQITFDSISFPLHYKIQHFDLHYTAHVTIER
jgi:hypothetical protein